MTYSELAAAHHAPHSATAFPRDPTLVLAQEILTEVFRFRRAAGSSVACPAHCRTCHEPHLAKITKAIENGAPIFFVLPAFPGKSPNPAKVLGHRPDLAERLALQFLHRLAGRIQRIYAPGAKILLCSDGRVFSDVVGLRESDVSEYQREIDETIASLGLTNLATFHLDQWSAQADFPELRRDLMKRFGTPLELLREKVVRGGKPAALPEEEDAHRMYCGITRFLVEDSISPHQTKSRTQIQKDCKARAYEVILRSNAWSALLAERFPEAVRLSIHPQACGSQKLGLRLVGEESWITPWHGVALKTGAGFTLVKRHEAEALGARLVEDANGRPSHFEMAGI